MKTMKCTNIFHDYMHPSNVVKSNKMQKFIAIDLGCRVMEQYFVYVQEYFFVFLLL